MRGKYASRFKPAAFASDSFIKQGFLQAIKNVMPWDYMLLKDE
jgi:hypothetical protein